MIARSLRGGANLRGALADATAHDTPAARSLRSVTSRVGAGERLGDALDAWAGRLEDPDADLARAVLRLGDATGAPVAGSLEQAATSLRDRAALAAEIQALSSQARLSAIVIGVAPLAFLTVSAAVDPTSAAFLVTTRFGLVCLVAGLGLDAIGVRWMRRLGLGVAR
jgi:tight adherence protein B